MIVKKIGVVLVIPLIIFLYLTIRVDNKYSLYLVPFVFLLIMLMMFSPQIEWWWAKRNPPKTNPQLIKFLNIHFAFFQDLDSAGKDKFLTRIALFNMARVFIPQVGDKVPTPIKTMVCAEGVRLTFGLEDYLMLTHERIVIYPHPFPSPRHRSMHNAEAHHEDGCLIFATAPVIAQFKGKAIVFNIVLYEWVAAFKYGRKNTLFPEFKEEDWQVFEQDFQTPKILVVASLGLPIFEMEYVGAVLYLTDQEKFRACFPRQAEQYLSIFKQ